MAKDESPNQDFMLARAVGLRGFGGRRSGELLFVAQNGEIEGTLFGGAADVTIRDMSAEMYKTSDLVKFLTIEIGDVSAVRAGLACGGEADVLITRSNQLPSGFIEKEASREPIALATVLNGKHQGYIVSKGSNSKIEVSDGVNVHDGFVEEIGARLTRGLDRRTNFSAIEEIQNNSVAIEVYSPPTEVSIIGEGDLAMAIIHQAELLGWSGQIASEMSEGLKIIGNMGNNDALVVLSHDHDLGVPLIATVLKKAKSTYIGCLGSRHTQEVRSELLSGLGFSPEKMNRIYGPIGLDLGSKTPEETAMAICSEILAHISGRSASSLTNSTGPING